MSRVIVGAPFDKLPSIRNSCVRQVLGLYKAANAGHIASSLSCMEILVYTAFAEMQLSDYIVLSKGHAAAGLYSVLSESGRLGEADLQSFYKDGTHLAAHPPCNGRIPSIPFGTGSLGHGLSLAAGLVFSQRFTKKNFRVFCVLSEGDCNEGSTWEAALFCAHHKLDQVVVIVDHNNVQGFGRSEDVLSLNPIVDKWKSFGFETTVAEDGNDFSSLRSAFEFSANAPKCIVAKTIKGHGVSYMEDTVDWHYWPMSDDQYRIALSEIPQDSGAKDA